VVVVEDAYRVVAEARVQIAELAVGRRVGAQLVHLAGLRVRDRDLFRHAADRKAGDEDRRRAGTHPGLLRHRSPPHFLYVLLWLLRAFVMVNVPSRCAATVISYPVVSSMLAMNASGALWAASVPVA